MTAILTFFAGPLGRWLAIGLMLVAFGGFCGIKGAQIQQRRDEARDAKRVQQQLEAQVAATQRTLTEEHRRQDAVQEIANDVRKQAEAYQADAAGNRAAGERLRDQLATAHAQCPGTAQPAAAAGSQAAGPSADLLADVQRRLAEAEDRTIEFADASRRAGLACERVNEALNPKE